MKTIAILTATRAEYGLLKPIIIALKETGAYNIKVLVTGAHLSPEFGLTYKEILDDNIQIDKKIDILLSSDTPSAISKSMGLAIMGFADYFTDNRPDALMVLGDRYETLAVCLSAMNERIPIIHLYGGDTTEGAVDEAIRHAITKLSYLHLVSNEESRNRVIQLGESPNRVFNVGAISVENALKMPLMAKKELSSSLGMNLEKEYAVVTFHPVTLENSNSKEQCTELLKAISMHDELNYIITKANADTNGRIINKLFEEYTKSHDNAMLFDSLGVKRYLSALKYASMVIGNSSSGLSEAPSFHIPTVNIGDRQRGRLKSSSVIDCMPNSSDISKAIIMAKSNSFKEICNSTVNPYGDGNTSSKIVDIINDFDNSKIDIKKVFYNIK